MTEREPGYYWIVWTDLADVEVTAKWPGPLLGQFDGRYWWFARMEVYKFDREVEVISSMLVPLEQFPDLAASSIDALRSISA